MRIRLTLLAFASATTIATAADLPSRAPDSAPAPVQAPVFMNASADWSGFYLGATVNGRRNGAEGAAKTAPTYALPTLGAGGAPNPLATQTDTLTANASPKMKYPFGGGLFGGYNMQSGSYVYGVEADANYTMDNASAFSAGSTAISGTYTNPTVGTDTRTATGTLSTAVRSRTNWDGSLRLRAGVLATPDMLVFATGGAAVAQINRTAATTGSVDFETAGGTLQATHDLTGSTATKKTSFGWTLGAGVDYRITDAWALRAEYRYSDFGKGTTTVATATCASGCTATNLTPGSVTVKTHDAFHAAKIGVAYKFGASSPSAIFARY